ncbi:unnamed protein product [Meganyctiphanes norvegica]|uniref:Reelin domain-containing protein n=1 Tax=Meganyctiphanes norvegica TaxID=48144 RepID=A0AAV2PS19_MEGNR
MRSYSLGLLVFVPMTLGYSGGAPPGVCGDLMPNHGPPPQTGESPFTILAPCKVQRGSKFELILNGNGKTVFKGFMVRAYEGTDGSTGQFHEFPHVQTLNCANLIENAATHTSASVKHLVKMAWTAPKYKTLVSFNSTVVVNYTTIYLNKPTYVDIL